jgi:hypothetical protein
MAAPDYNHPGKVYQNSKVFPENAVQSKQNLSENVMPERP